eukprot:109567-Pyramimonas_sp.AAC.1
MKSHGSVDLHSRTPRYTSEIEGLAHHRRREPCNFIWILRILSSETPGDPKVGFALGLKVPGVPCIPVKSEGFVDASQKPKESQ